MKEFQATVTIEAESLEDAERILAERHKGVHIVKEFQATVTIEAESMEDAERILAERLDHDEEYDGVGDYTISYEWSSDA